MSSSKLCARRRRFLRSRKLPLPAAPAAPEAPKAPPAKTGKKIVVIDDTEMLLIFVEDTLATADPTLQIVTAFTGSEGVRRAEVMLPDLVLLDYSLPDLRGDQVCERLLQNEATSRIPVLMMSGHVPEMMATAEKYRNVVATIAKPFMSDALVALVRETLAKGPLPAPAAPVRQRKRQEAREEEWRRSYERSRRKGECPAVLAPHAGLRPASRLPHRSTESPIRQVVTFPPARSSRATAQPRLPPCPGSHPCRSEPSDPAPRHEIRPAEPALHERPAFRRQPLGLPASQHRTAARSFSVWGWKSSRFSSLRAFKSARFAPGRPPRRFRSPTLHRPRLRKTCWLDLRSARWNSIRRAAFASCA